MTTTTAIAVAAATLASYVAGSLWYLALGKRWRTAVGWIETAVPYRPSAAELALAFAGQLLMAVALAVLLRKTGVTGALGGTVAGCGVWLGFVLPTLATNVTFQRRNSALIWQDGGHWLLLLAIQGAVLGLLQA